MKSTFDYLIGWYSPGIWLCVVLGVASAQAQPEVDDLRRAVELFNEGDLSGAEKQAEKALANPATRPVAYATLGAIRLRLKDYPESERLLKQAVALNPNLVGAHLNLGNLYLLQDKLDKAKSVYQQVLGKDPQNSTARFALARVESQLGNHGRSLQLADPIVQELRRSDDGLLMLARNYFGIEDKDAARGLTADWIALPRPDNRVGLSFAVLFSQNGLASEAIKVLNRIKEIHGPSYEVAFNLAGSYLLQGDPKQALANYELALSYDPLCVPCLRELSRIAGQEGDLDKALFHLIQAKRKDADNPEVLFEFGKVCLRKNLFDDAIAALERAVQLRPEHEAFRYVLASALVGKKRYDEARGLLEQLLAKKPQDYLLNYAMGATYYLEMKLEEAASYLRRSISSQPDQVASYYYLGMVVENPDTAPAVKIFEEVLKRDAHHAKTYEALGTIRLRQGELTEAQELLEKATQLEPSLVKARYQLSLLYRRLGQKDQAEEQIKLFKQLQEQEKEELLDFHLLTPH